MHSQRLLFFGTPYLFSLPSVPHRVRPPVAKRNDADLVDRMNAELMAHEALYNERLLRAMQGETLERQVLAGGQMQRGR